MSDTDTLARQITLAARAYYEGAAMLSDEQFDNAVEQLRSLDQQHPVLRAPGWGYKPDGKFTAQHEFFVGSLPKAHDLDKLMHGDVLSPKFDGLSIVAYYDNGKLRRVLTRGDGTTGIIVTGRVNVPNVCADDWIRAVRGEAVLSYSTFADLNEQREAASDAPYANPRNAVAGIINAHESPYHHLPMFVAYEIRSSNESEKHVGMGLDSMYVNGVQEALSRNGFNTSPYLQVEDPSEITLDYLQQWSQGQPYPTDGVVHNAIQAIKFPTEALTTEVVQVHWDQSEKGRLIPVLEVKPVELYGTTVTRVTAYHAQYVKDHVMGPGAVVKITKANEIIPYITEVVSAAPGGPAFPAAMAFPNCNWEGVHLVVKDQEHIDKKRLFKFVKTLVELDGLGDSNLEKIFESLSVNTVPEFLKVLETTHEFVAVQGSGNYEDLFAGKLTDHLIKLGAGILQAFVQPIDRELLLFALNLDAVGKTASRDLAPFLGQISDPPDAGIDLDADWKEAIKQNKEKAIASIEAHRSLIFSCWDLLAFTELADLKPVVLTGAMSKPRKTMVAELKKLGFREGKTIKEGVIVIASDPEGGSNKLKKARKVGAEILTEQQFFEKHGG